MTIYVPLAASPYWDQFKTPEKQSATSLRFGFGPSVLFGDLSKTYEKPGPSASFDWMFYRWRAKGNSGFDFYSRLSGAFYDEKNYFNKYMSTTSVEVGCRGMLSSFFFPDCLHYYVLAGPKILYCREKISREGLDMFDASNLFSLGVGAGIGVEYSPFRSWGFFLEIDGGYSPVGDSKANAEGLRLILGTSYRTQIR